MLFHSKENVGVTCITNKQTNKIYMYESFTNYECTTTYRQSYYHKGISIINWNIYYLQKCTVKNPQNNKTKQCQPITRTK